MKPANVFVCVPLAVRLWACYTFSISHDLLPSDLGVHFTYTTIRRVHYQ